MDQPVTHNILLLEDASFRYPDGSVGLDRCSFAIERASRTVVLGPNGAGKTTLLLHLNGILRPQTGRVHFDGTPLDYGRQGLRKLRSRVGLVFQNPDAQVFSASVREDISFGPLNLGLDKEAVISRVEEALAAVELADCADKPVHSLSYGQKKRVCIAGVLAMKPDVMILDEPTSGLDMRVQQELLEILGQLHAQGITIVLATHDIDLAYAWADRACVLDGGRLAAQCGAEEFSQAFPSFIRYGIGAPRVAAINRALVARGLVPQHRRAPRSQEELTQLLTAPSLFPWPTGEEGEQMTAAPLPSEAVRLPLPSTDEPAVILAAFGTTTRARETYHAFEDQVRASLPAREVRWAFTSRIVRQRLNARGAETGREERHLSLSEVLTTLRDDGYRRVIVQPVLVFPGEEYEKVVRLATGFPGLRVQIGGTLLHRWESVREVVGILARDFLPASEGCNVIVAHGSPQTAVGANSTYLGLDRYLSRRFTNAFLGCVEGIIPREDALEAAKAHGAKRVRFIPLMFVAGDHVMNDVMGEDEAAGEPSWKTELTNTGKAVDIPMVEKDGKAQYRSLGLIPEINEVFIREIKRALGRL